MRMLKLAPLLMAVTLLAACGGDDDDDTVAGAGDAGEGQQQDGQQQEGQQVSFTAFVKDMLDNPSNSEPVSVNGVNFSFEDNNNPAAFDDML
jgi:hypothetical protein